MSLPLVTRFGPQPLLDNEIANKAYVDAGGGGGGSGRFLMFMGNLNYASNSTFYWNIMGFNIFSTVESVVATPISFAFTIERHFVNFSVNTRSNDTDCDGSDASTVQVPNGTTGVFDSGAISVAVLSGSLVDFQIVINGGTGGHVGMQTTVNTS